MMTVNDAASVKQRTLAPTGWGDSRGAWSGVCSDTPSPFAFRADRLQCLLYLASLGRMTSIGRQFSLKPPIAMQSGDCQFCSSD